MIFPSPESCFLTNDLVFFGALMHILNWLNQRRTPGNRQAASPLFLTSWLTKPQHSTNKCHNLHVENFLKKGIGRVCDDFI